MDYLLNLAPLTLKPRRTSVWVAFLTGWQEMMPPGYFACMAARKRNRSRGRPARAKREAAEPQAEQEAPVGEPPQPAEERASQWLKIFDRHVAVALVGGIISFCAVSALYDQFYGAFGLTSSDMGLDYKETLIRSWGFILFSVVATMVYVSILWQARRHRHQFLWAWKRYVLRQRVERPEVVDDAAFTRNFGFFVLGVGLGLAWLGSWAVGKYYITPRIDDVMNGKSVHPLHLRDDSSGWRLIFLDIHSLHVRRVAPVRVPGTAPCCKHLMHIGDSDRTYVLYCVESKQVVRISMERYVIQTSS